MRKNSVGRNNSAPFRHPACGLGRSMGNVERWLMPELRGACSGLQILVPAYQYYGSLTWNEVSP